ncbi:nucleotide-binding alpha-beta plait domain-containing protein [Tanacetum coccineum]|uniref:Nucleotide-binding alpha-beta plait domain-containing protein n=1 Tax=Tanacetum coccineum TaxID=301880 RepID=A0ABQ4XY14_9ASTR
MGHRCSDVDEVKKISTSIFVMNFSNQFYAKDLWKVCNHYGNVIDAFILNRRSKSGKRFGFVLFIKIFDVDRLVNNLCTIWVERFKLHANIARFQRSPLKNSNTQFTNKAEKKSVLAVVHKDSGVYGYSSSYARVVKIRPRTQNVKEENKPSIVVLANDGFDYIKLKYMGGYWVMIEFQTEASKEKFKANVGIGSWFSQLEQGSNLFHIDESHTWVDIEDIPLKIPDFAEDDEEESDTDNEIRDEELHDESACMHNHATVEGESDVEEVFENIFENEQYQAHKKDDLNIGQNDIRLEDPFNIYDLLNKK